MTIGIRKLQVKIGPPGGTGKLWEDLYMSARVEMANGRAPNKATIKMYNLSKTSVNFIEKPGLTVQLLAGVGVLGNLFLGDITKRGVKTRWAMPDRETEIKAADGRRAFRDSLFVASYPAQTTRSQILNDLLSRMGIARGYIDPTIPERTFPAGTMWAMSSRDVLSELWAQDKAKWSIKSGALQVLREGQPDKSLAIVVGPETGLIGTIEKTDKGVKFKHDFDSRFQPNAVVVSKSTEVQGSFRIVKVSHNIDSFGNQWESDVNAVPR
jgi:hypothetical protein